MILISIIRDCARVLTFRQPSVDIARHWPAYLAFGLICSWLAGVGRYWDNPKAELWQYLGLGSVAYVFVLALILWVLIKPLKPVRWSYRSVLIFVTLTSPPAILYAIPVERFLAPDIAQAANAWFLGIVAFWRVALLFWFLKVIARLSGLTIVVASLLPITLIVISLALLNLEHVVFNLMSGINPDDRSPNDIAYQIVTLLAIFSFMSAPFLIIGYVIAIVRAHVYQGGIDD
ncbi:hypothetical protein [Allohahella marinimesophila]|uniref:Yip1 domain-containing protein n=1 Tax=Allohahella marinimesophila TaxID=1054972 RepID=A0ABP7NXG2_9GAMM